MSQRSDSLEVAPVEVTEGTLPPEGSMEQAPAVYAENVELTRPQMLGARSPGSTREFRTAKNANIKTGTGAIDRTAQDTSRCAGH